MTGGTRSLVLVSVAVATALSLAACNAKVRPTGVLPREYVPPPPAERDIGIKPKQGEITAAPAPEAAQPQRGLSVPSR